MGDSSVGGVTLVVRMTTSWYELHRDDCGEGNSSQIPKILEISGKFICGIYNPITRCPIGGLFLVGLQSNIDRKVKKIFNVYFSALVLLFEAEVNDCQTIPG